MKYESGNAFVITLISVILMGALTFVLMRQMNGNTNDSLSAERASLYADRLIGEGNAMVDVIQKLLETGATITTLNFDLPGSGSYTSGNTLVKVYHPSGGGLNVPSTPPAEMMQTGYGGTTGWQVQYGQNVEWTPTSATDVLYTFLGLSDSVCQKINEKLTGTATAISTTAVYNNVFVHGAGTDADFTTTLCSGCSGIAMACVNNGSANAFYVVAAQR